jgi:hypothetical protein
VEVVARIARPIQTFNRPEDIMGNRQVAGIFGVSMLCILLGDFVGCRGPTDERTNEPTGYQSRQGAFTGCPNLGGQGGAGGAPPVSCWPGGRGIKGNFDGDSAEDVIIVTPNGSYEYLGQTSGVFVATDWVRGDLTLGNVNYTVGDFNGDGRSDVIITTANGSHEYTGRAPTGFTPNVWVRPDLTLGRSPTPRVTSTATTSRT